MLFLVCFCAAVCLRVSYRYDVLLPPPPLLLAAAACTRTPAAARIMGSCDMLCAASDVLAVLLYVIYVRVDPGRL